ncbi:MAG TPA: PTS sugar transporter subunit IIA [Rectinemataceae bacterium]|nr:PTS sugar transporter subunit IIA [Rectinemataceae bacterium]
MQLSVKDAAALLTVPEKTIYRWIKQGSLPSHYVNEEYRFNRSELLEWATEQGIQPSPDIFSGEEGGGAALPDLSQALEAGGIAYDLAGENQAEVLRSLVDLLKLPGDVDRDYLYEVLMARETLGSTGIGDGIAIPHVRNPVVLQVSRPTLTLCFLARPIDFRAIDNKPVDTLFAIISPTVKSHLHLLSRLGYVLRNGEFREAVRSRAGRELLMRSLAAAESSIAEPPQSGAGEGRR